MGVFARADSLAYAAEALMLAGDWSKAQEHLVQALEMVRCYGERMLLPDFMMLQARCLLAEHCVEAARQSLQEALAEARDRKSLWHELRVLTQVCELEGVSEAELAELAAVLAQLTEGRENSNCQRAAKLIERGARPGSQSLQ